MTDKQPDALRLADEFDGLRRFSPEHFVLLEKAAAELRRLHEVREECERQYQEKVEEIIRLHEVNAELVSLLKEVLHYSKHVSNVAYNLGQHHDQWGDSIWPSIERLDRASRNAKAALAKATGENYD